MSNGESSGGRHRSPVYPANDLETAVDRLEEFWKLNSTHSVNVEAAIQGWGLSPTGSTGKRAVAALIHYGLLEDEGTGSNREVWVSELGKDVVVPPNDRTQKKALQKAALSPTVYRRLWDEYGADLPSRRAVKRKLLDWDFNESVIDSIIDDYEATVEYSGLDDSTMGRSETSDSEDDSRADETPSEDRGTPDSQDDKESRIRGGEREMPSTKATDKQHDEDLPIWLPGGIRAVLRVPVPMSEEQFQHLKESLPSHLDLQKEGMTHSGDE